MTNLRSVRKWFGLLPTTSRAARITLGCMLVLTIACGDKDKPSSDQAPAPVPTPTPVPADVEEPVVAAKLKDPISLWIGGEAVEQVDAAAKRKRGVLMMDLGEDWTPYIFSEYNDEGGHVPNLYRDTYLALARGEFPKDHHGERAKRDKYLELYGILPTLGQLRKRFRKTAKLACREKLSFESIRAFSGFIAYRDGKREQKRAKAFDGLERQVDALRKKMALSTVAEIDVASLGERDAARVREYLKSAPDRRVIREVQERLACEGFFKGKRRYVRGAMDWSTHEALAEFERRHRAYGWGFIGKDALVALQQTPMEAARESVLRVLTERAMHEYGVLEDGSRSTLKDGTPRTFVGVDGEKHAIPNFEKSLRAAVIKAFGLDSAESTLDWLNSLGELKKGKTLRAALKVPPLPEYYSSNMEISVDVDRGDVWYDFPYRDDGTEMAQPVSRRPRNTIYVTYNKQRIPLARFGTTIGGWRSEMVDGAVMWKYKDSPVGKRVWSKIVAAPVWIPPESTPPKDLLKRRPGKSGKEKYYINYHETGPSYASAYGLVAAYHQKFGWNEDGTIRLGGDKGIRTHGSVDYMSIMRRHSHGCHRMHNHRAVRLMSFVLRRRDHERIGQQKIIWERILSHEGFDYNFNLQHKGYLFRLKKPIVINVLEGRIRGRRSTPIEYGLPKYNKELEAYVMPDGRWVRIDRFGTITEREIPEDYFLDGGVMPMVDGAVPTLDGGVLPITPGVSIDAGVSIDDLSLDASTPPPVPVPIPKPEPDPVSPTPTLTPPKPKEPPLPPKRLPNPPPLRVKTIGVQQ